MPILLEKMDECDSYIYTIIGPVITTDWQKSSQTPACIIHEATGEFSSYVFIYGVIREFTLDAESS